MNTYFSVAYGNFSMLLVTNRVAVAHFSNSNKPCYDFSYINHVKNLCSILKFAVFFISFTHAKKMANLDSPHQNLSVENYYFNFF